MTRYSEDSEAPAVIVSTLFLMVTSILGSLARLGTKWWKFGRLFCDDYYLILALLASITQSIAISMAVQNGYGEHLGKLSSAQIDAITRSQYTATILHLFSIGFSQLAFLGFVQQLTPSSHNRLVFLVLQISIASWAMTGIFAAAFQCKPRQWDYIYGNCYDRVQKKRSSWLLYPD